jgi:hypothetical protein
MDDKPVVLIEWTDAENGEGWHSELALDDYYQSPLLPVRSVGWLMHENNEWIVIAQSLGEQDPELAGDLLKIPRAMIREIRPMQMANGKKPDDDGS